MPLVAVGLEGDLRGKIVTNCWVVSQELEQVVTREIPSALATCAYIGSQVLSIA